MKELIAAIAIIILLIILFKVRKTHKLQEPAKQEKESKPANKPILDTKPKIEPAPQPQAKEPLHPAEPAGKPVVEPKTNASVTLPSKDSTEHLPQDSMLRRHYLANLRAMIESLNPLHPTDSALSRHYDSLIAAQIEQCISDKGAVEQLICKYEAHKKTLAQQSPQSKIPDEPLLKAGVVSADSVVQHDNPKLPEDSVLRRHTITHLKAMAESNK